MSYGTKGFLGSVHNSAGSKATVTKEGGQAYTLNLEEKLCNAFTLGLINGNFYTNQDDVVKAVKDLFEETLKTNPLLATKYAVYAAEELNMKFMPTLWLVYLSTLQNKDLFKKAFPRIIGKNVNLLHDFINLCRQSDIRPGGIHFQKVKGTNRGLGQSLKKTINKWTYQNLNEYNSTRFTNKLEDILRLTRPEDKNEELKKYFQYIFKSKSGPRKLTFPRAAALHETINILSDENKSNEQFNQALDNIKKYKIQMDEIKFTFGKLTDDEKKIVYMEFVPNLRYAALVSNLVAIERTFAISTRKINKLDPMGSGKYFEQTEVLSTDIPQELINIVYKKLSSFEDYKASKMLFFRLLTAHEMIITPQWKHALNKTLSQAGKIAFADLPTNRKIMCSADTSGSMASPVTSSLTALDIATYLTAAVSLSTGAKAYATATHTKTVGLANDNLIDCAVKIKNTDVGFGTRFETLLDCYNGENVVVLITDGQQSDNMEYKWKKLNKPKDAKLIIWHVVGFDYFNKISKESNVLYLKGYNDNLLNVLSNLITGKAGQSDIVNNIKL